MVPPMLDKFHKGSSLDASLNRLPRGYYVGLGRLTFIRATGARCSNWRERGLHWRAVFLGHGQRETGLRHGKWRCRCIDSEGSRGSQLGLQSHVICTPGASAVIKTYSPNLMVHPLMRQSPPPKADTKEHDADPEHIAATIIEMLSRLHVPSRRAWAR